MSSGPRPGSAAVDPDTINAIASLTIKVRRVVEGLQGGTHMSPHHGASVEFAEHKRYAPGDDIRHIDWRVWARTDRFFVKQHQREVVLRCLMVLDCSASMGYSGTRALFDKLSYGQVLLGALAHVLVRQGDAAGLLTFARHPIDTILPKCRPDHLSSVLARLGAVKPVKTPATGYAEALSKAADVAGRRAMIVVVSDLWGAGRDTELALGHLAARGHDVAVFHVLDPDELDLPFDRPFLFRGLEGETGVDADPTLLREDYRREIEAVRSHWRMVCGESGIDLQPALTSRPPERVLADFASARYRRVKTA